MFGLASLSLFLGILGWALFGFLKLALHNYKNPLNNVPGPWYAAWTSMRLKLAVITGQRIHYVQSLHERFGTIVRISPTEVAVSEPELVQQIHKHGSEFKKSEWYMKFTTNPRQSIFTISNHSEYAARRRMLARGFSKTELRSNWEAIVHERVRLAVNTMSDEGECAPVDVLRWLILMAMDISTRVIFGEDYKILENKQVTEHMRLLQCRLQGAGIASEIPVIRMLGPLVPLQIFQDLFNSDPILHKHASVAVAHSKSANKKQNIFASIALQAEIGEVLDDKDLAIEAHGLIIAGSDTTAITLSYLFWVLSNRPTLMKQLQEEHSQLPIEYSDSDVEKLPILNAVIYETLRLYGAVPGGLPRTVPPAGCTLGLYYCPPGTTVTTHAFCTHRQSSAFTNPHEFDHTRWLVPQKKLAKAAYTPFGAGPRTCIGIHLAQMVLRLTAAEFIGKVKEIKPAPSTTEQSMEMENYFLIQPKAHKCELFIHS